MKKAELFLYSLYALGIVLKLFKLPMHTVFILVILLAILIYYIFCLIKKSKDIHSILAGFLTVIWLFCLLTLLKHFSFQSIVWITSISASVPVLFLLYKNKKLISLNSIFCFVIIAFTVFIKFLPAHNTYYLTNIKLNHEIEIDYYSWDKYSWFLYMEGKDDEAMQANKSAQAAVEKCLQNPIFGDENEYFTLIKEHELAIKNKNWNKYR